MAEYAFHPRSGVDGLRLGRTGSMRIGNSDVRFLGGPLGCLVMVLISVLLSIALTFLLNVML
jgi:hypothetical protein